MLEMRQLQGRRRGDRRAAIGLAPFFRWRLNQIFTELPQSRMRAATPRATRILRFKTAPVLWPALFCECRPARTAPDSGNGSCRYTRQRPAPSSLYGLRRLRGLGSEPLFDQLAKIVHRTGAAIGWKAAAEAAGKPNAVAVCLPGRRRIGAPAPTAAGDTIPVEAAALMPFHRQKKTAAEKACRRSGSGD